VRRYRQGRTARLKPVTVDGFVFASGPESTRYEALKREMGSALQVAPSHDGRLLVCTWHTERGKRCQTFVLHRARSTKYNAVKTAVGDLVFASKNEARRFVDLTHLQAAGEIRDLVHHPAGYDLVVNGVHIGRYTPDFTYTLATGAQIVEDVKSEATRKARDYPLRKKLMLACHGIEIHEVQR